MSISSKHTVILDSNMLYGDPQLRKGALSYLVRACRAAGLKVFLPEVVVLELIEQYKSELQRRYTSASASVRKLGSYLYDGATPEVSIDLSDLAKGYELWLRDRLQTLDISVLPVADVTQQAMLDRAIKKRRPFTRDRPTQVHIGAVTRDTRTP